MDRWAKWVGALLVCCLVAASTGVAVAAEAAANIDAVFKQVAAYKYGASRAPLIEAEKLIRAFTAQENRHRLTRVSAEMEKPESWRMAGRTIQVPGDRVYVVEHSVVVKHEPVAGCAGRRSGL